MVNRPDKSPATEGERAEQEMQTQPTPATDDATPAADAAPAQAGEGEGEPSSEPATPPETPRQRVARRFQERRRAEIEGNPLPTLLDEPPASAEPAALTPGAQPAAQPPAPATDDPILKLRIDNRDVELPQSEVIRLAQTNAAIEARGRALAELNLQLNARREELAALSRTAPAADTTGARPRSTEPPLPAPRERTGLDEAQLRDIAERITGGTLEEQTAALGELIAAVQQPREEPDVDGKINAAFRAREAAVAVDGMVQEFADSYPDIAADPEFREMAYRRTVGEMLSDLEAAGVKPADMAKLRSAAPLHIANAHRAFREAVNGDGSRAFPNVRHYKDVLRAAGDGLMAKIGKALPAREPPPQPPPQPRPSNGLAARTELKRALTPTPRATDVRAEPRAETPPGGNPNAKAAVSKIAALRNRGRGAVAAH